MKKFKYVGNETEFLLLLESQNWIILKIRRIDSFALCLNLWMFFTQQPSNMCKKEATVFNRKGNKQL